MTTSSRRSKPSFLRALLPLALAAAALAAGQAHADAVFESGDAGQTQSTAQNTTSSGSLQSIGSIAGALSGSTDADFYIVNIVDPSSFWASTDNGSTAVFDTQLFLLTLAGAPVAVNDDASGLSSLSTLSGLNSLVAGLYILGISQSGYDPVNVANQLLFASGSLTSIRGAAAGLSPAVLGGLSDGTFFPDGGDYLIQLRGVDNAGSAVPEPSTLLLASLAAVCGLGVSRRRRPSRSEHSLSS